ncbi:MAG: aspartate kinase [Chloroflexi bacterium]|nr:MAG: aspartate kinase [Chloroflexota bacterium]
MIVMKFGGTSVGSADAFAQVAAIVADKAAEQAQTPRPGVAVVTSAMSGVTNLLIDAAQRAANGDEEFFLEAENALRVKHQTVAGQLIDDGNERAALGRIFDERLQEFTRLCSSIAVLGELTKRGLDVVSGLGERLAAPLLAAVLRARGVPAEYIDATEIVVTDAVFGGAAPQIEPTEARCRARLLPLLEQGTVPVITGFIGATAEGIPTTLGRGGSDYSGAIIGAVLEADEIQIWTDVNGVMSADPRIVPNARSLRQLSYEEVAELAYYGAKVLHPKTVTPAIEKQIPLRVLNTFQPEHPGTRIAERSDHTGGTVKAITSIRGMNLITVAGRGMIGVPGIAARTFQAVAGVGANVLMISQSSSEQSICFVVPEGSADTVIDALRAEFKVERERRYIDEIGGHGNVAIIAVVGSGMRGTPGLAAGIFRAVGNEAINVIAIAQGSSEANVSLVVEETQAAEAVRAIHDIFELHKPSGERSSQLQRAGGIDRT